MPTPTTNVGMPAAAAAATASVAARSSAGLSVIVQALDGFVRLQPAGQFGSPSVASRRYFGFESDTLIRYAAPDDTASLVGVFPVGLVLMMALAMAVAFPTPMETTGALLAPQAPLSEKNFRPQLTVMSVAPTT